jgi:UDP-N-acetylglucosamine--N-acetylmuramyl-(pentapeptide) pyrophosphoryl-undecaprenol N-acetylglucosamine transferase
LTLRIPVVLTEADSRLGLTNRLLAPFARRVCLAFPHTVGASSRRAGRYRVTGRPLFPLTQERGAARERFGIAPEETCVLVFGGSLGARSINLAAIEAFTSGSIHVLHVCGAREYAELAERELPAGYDLREYLDLADFADALAAADLAVARAGGSVFEIAAHGLPAILVPYPHAAGDHQRANARWMCEAGAAISIPDGKLTGARLAGEVAALLADRSRLAAMASAARSLARPQAARLIAGELLEAAGG